MATLFQRKARFSRMNHYYALVYHREDRQHVDVWPIGLRDPLPNIPIPLREPDAPLMLDLKAMLDRSYDGADLGKDIYTEAPEALPSPEDAAWAQAFVPRRK